MTFNNRSIFSRRLLFIGAWALTGFSTGCQPDSLRDSAAQEPGLQATTVVTIPTLISQQPAESGQNPQQIQVGYINENGNHFVAGSTSLDWGSPIELLLPFQPTWLLGVEINAGTGWLAVADSGEFQFFEVIDRDVQFIKHELDRLPAGTQPTIYTDGFRLHLLQSTDPEASAPSPPVYLPSSGRVAYIDEKGDLVIHDAQKGERLAVEAIPDARLLVDEYDRILMLGRRTTRYAHGVLGDSIEAGSILLLQTNPSLKILTEIMLEEYEVIEGVSPIWVDLNGDEVREILVTVSDQDLGAYLAIFSETGEMLARSDAIGRSYRWRHQVSAVDYLGEGTHEITAVLTPHIGGVLQFFAWEGDRLNVTAEIPGVSTHKIGSGNLDMALTGDFDGDRLMEVLVPDLNYEVLGAFQRVGDAIQMDWQIPLGNTLTTNLAGVAFMDGGLGFGIGLENGAVQIWLPE